MSYPTIDEYKRRILIFNEWKAKNDPKEAAKNINELMGNKKYITIKRVKDWYIHFEKHDPKNGPLQYTILSVSPSSSDSISLLTNRYYFPDKVVVKNGRFIFFPYYYREKGNKIFDITVYDLFSGNRRENPVSFDTSTTTLIISGSYLLALKYYDTLKNLHILKINYEDLTITEIQTVTLQFSCNKILLDQLGDQKFVIFPWERQIIHGQINEENGSVVFGEPKTFDKFIMVIDSARLMGNKLQGFTQIWHSAKFCEINLDTMEKIEKDAKIELGENNDGIRCSCPFIHCWTKNCFYGFFEADNRQNKLMCFDIDFLKWTDVKILAFKPSGMFFDENEIMTLQVGNIWSGCAFYRLSLRKPDKLMNLVRLKAARESTLYGNDKYLNAIDSLAINL